MKPVTLNSKRWMSFSHFNKSLLFGISALGFLSLGSNVLAQTERPDWEVPLRPANPLTYAITVNTTDDGEILPDEKLTLREAIALTNGDIQFIDLSDIEKLQVQPQPNNSSITFTFLDSTASSPTIALQNVLPPLCQAGLVLDGTVNGGEDRVTLKPDLQVILDAEAAALEEDDIDPKHFVRILDGDSLDRYVSTDLNLRYGIPMGFSVIANDITIKGFQFYGFHTSAYKAYPFVGAIVLSTGQMTYDLWRLPDIIQEEPPQNTLIEDNIFGIEPENITETGLIPGAGLVVFDAIAAKITNNTFTHLNGSAILTGKTAHSLEISDNLFLKNGGNALGDAVRLEGDISDTTLTNNHFCGNSGAGIFLFKPEGAISIEDNIFDGNGYRNTTDFISTHPDRGVAAIYLMGSDHQVTGNEIMNQGGPGVVVAAYPISERNFITDNFYSNLQGLSIDLATRQNTEIHTYQTGDGPNPWRSSRHRRKDTGNGAVNAPHFVGLEFFPFGDQVQISGTADPGVTISLYRVLEDTLQFGPLSEFIMETTTDEAGKFLLSLSEWEYGDRLSAIATSPTHGTSEPAENAIIRSFEESYKDFPIDRILPEKAEQACQGFLVLNTEPE